MNHICSKLAFQDESKNFIGRLWNLVFRFEKQDADLLCKIETRWVIPSRNFKSVNSACSSDGFGVCIPLRVCDTLSVLCDTEFKLQHHVHPQDLIRPSPPSSGLCTFRRSVMVLANFTPVRCFSPSIPRMRWLIVPYTPSNVSGKS